MSIDLAFRCRLALAALLVTGLVAHAEPQRTPAGWGVPRLSPGGARRLSRRMDADATIRRMLAVCPADVYRRRGEGGARVSSPGVSLAGCGQKPEACLARCLDAGNSAACFMIAEIAQATPRLDPLYGDELFQIACAAGAPAGCTNRAADLRSTRFAGDPYATRPEADRQECQFRSFDLACTDDDPWGCAMRGQAYTGGEGVGRDATAARRDFERTCEIEPRFEACTFARRQLEEMGEPPPPADKAKAVPIKD